MSRTMNSPFGTFVFASSICLGEMSTPMTPIPFGLHQDPFLRRGVSYLIATANSSAIFTVSVGGVFQSSALAAAVGLVSLRLVGALAVFALRA
jgi:hypothetical protein